MTAFLYTVEREVTFETYNTQPDRVFEHVKTQLDVELEQQGLEAPKGSNVVWHVYQRRESVLDGQPHRWVPFLGAGRPVRIKVTATIRARARQAVPA